MFTPDSKVTLVPPTATSPSFTLRLLPTFKLELAQSSLMGSRAKLADVPKVHQMIEQRIQATIASKLGEYRIMLPGVGNVASSDGSGPSGATKKTVDVYVQE